jgi:hypothetical protein
VARPTFSQAPTAEQLAAIECPMERFALISRFGRSVGTLPHWLSEHRDADYLAAVAKAGTAAALAAFANVSPGRLSQIAKRALGQAAAPGSVYGGNR